jgi:hypothetical protein
MARHEIGKHARLGSGSARTSVGGKGGPSVPVAERLMLDELEVAALCGVSRHTVRRWKAAGLLQPVQLPFAMRRVLFMKTDVESFLAGLHLDSHDSAC